MQRFLPVLVLALFVFVVVAPGSAEACICAQPNFEVKAEPGTATRIAAKTGIAVGFAAAAGGDPRTILLAAGAAAASEVADAAMDGRIQIKTKEQPKKKRPRIQSVSLQYYVDPIAQAIAVGAKYGWMTLAARP